MCDENEVEIEDLGDEELKAVFERIKEDFFYNLAEEDDLVEVLVEEALKRKKITVSENDFYALAEEFIECFHGMAHWQ